MVIRLADVYDRPLPLIHAVIDHSIGNPRQANRAPTTNDTAAAVVVKDK